ncbi:hypothetical protein AM493_00770 [Flavobacterium akiainvivens]|uniref:DUF4199 domain-containing protein n=1 Tax=Flavobacterium akiainvivens TaxID=1202724 RepID=A0A0M8MER9_9FLAO|nr:DUF4199 domain-containing protein [Flavobacterium akiainvivens]KOS04741.1 hypothetical protein AM493_00770 [Flavobacterium akiainvivens]SFQ66812.1 Protein of unknown function [Flavobacterium akiainvivens]
MKKLVLTHGLIAGGISVIGYLITFISGAMHNEMAMLIGFASMLLAFSLIFVATVKFRKQQGGVVSFGQAFQIGLYISLIASTVYVLVWLYNLYNVYPDFAEKYSAEYLEGLKAAGASAEKLAKATAEMNQFVADYKKPWYVIVMTYTEILPIGIIVSLISALILKRKPNL